MTTAKEPLPVYIKLANGTETKILGWACPECMLYHSPLIYACRAGHAEETAKRAAAECCHRVCKDCGCDMGASPGWTCCNVCRAKHEEEKARKRIAEARHIAWMDYHQIGVFCETLDEIYFDLDALDDDLVSAHTECRLDLDSEVPVMWALHARPLHIDADQLVYDALDDHHEEAAAEVSQKDRDRLQVMLDKWCRDVGVESFDVDYGCIVDMPDGWIESLRADIAEFREEMST